MASDESIFMASDEFFSMDDTLPEIPDVPNTRRMSLSRLAGTIFKKPTKQFKNVFSKRKRSHHDDDTVSLQNFEHHLEEEPKKKRQSVAFLSPAQSITRAVTGVMKRSASSLSLRSIKEGSSTPGKKVVTTPYRKPPPATPHRRESICWSETMQEEDLARFDSTERKRQEAIFELFNGEKDLVEDLKMLRDIYYLPMKKLSILSEEDANVIFGNIDKLRSVHDPLIENLTKCRQGDNTIAFVGEILLDWAPHLQKYVGYCANQFEAKALLDEKRQEKKVADFLQRCQESAFSRKLDLWSFLDVPRSRLVKYPLLLEAILKYTPDDHDDFRKLPEAIDAVRCIVSEMNQEQGVARCEFIKNRISYASDGQKSPLIDESTAILCDGILKQQRGLKLHVFLLNKVFIMTRPVQHDRSVYDMYHTPIPVSELFLDENVEGKSGSFRNTLTSGSFSGKERFFFKVGSVTTGSEFVLAAMDEHDKTQWTKCFKAVIDPSRVGSHVSRAVKPVNRDPLRKAINVKQRSQLSLQNAATTSEGSNVKRQGSSASDRDVCYGYYSQANVSPSAISVNSSFHDIEQFIDDAPLAHEDGIDLSDNEDDIEEEEDESEDELDRKWRRHSSVDSPLWELNEDDSKENSSNGCSPTLAK